jgi:hypothetical protein
MSHTRMYPLLPKSRQYLRVLTLLAVGLGFPLGAASQGKPCKGFVGAQVTRRELLRSCGEPLEIIEEEPRRITLWRYPGYPFVAVRSEYQNPPRQMSDTIADVWRHVLSDQTYNQTLKRRLATTTAKVGANSFRQIIDEAAELPDSKSPASGAKPPGAQPPELASPPDGN